MSLTQSCCGISSGDDGSIFECYRRYCREWGVCAETVPACGYREKRLCLELPPGKGRGWAEMMQLERGLGVGLCDFLLDHPLESSFHDDAFRLGFRVLLAGCFEFTDPEMDVREHVRGCRLWLRRGRVENFRFSTGCVMRGLSIELPPAMVDAWLDGAPGELARALEAMIRGSRPVCGQPGHAFSPLIRSFPGMSSIVQIATRLLAMPRGTVCEVLRFESLTLDLLARILSLDSHAGQEGAGVEAWRRRAPVDEAVDILRAEWAHPPTISALARRVGLNECYLKAWFRRRTGLSIGEYVRKLRMENALELIESGRCSILQAALSVGYSNPSHFSAAFKRFHGRLPSHYMSKA